MRLKIIFIYLVVILPNVAKADFTWTYGKVNVTETYASKIYVRWAGPLTQECSDDDVAFDEESLGGEETFKRAFAIALTATVSQKPIRFKLDGCLGSLQRATVVQLCGNPDCSY